MASKRVPKIDPNNLPKGIRKGKDNRFHWECDRTRTDGSRYRKAGSCKTAEEAWSKYCNAVEEFETGEEAQGRIPTLKEWADYVKENIFPVMPSRSGKPYAPTTVEGYVGILDRDILPYLGDILLNKLTPEHIEAMFAKRGGAPQSRRNIRNLGSKLYEIAIRRGKVPHGYNPFKAVLIAKPKRKRDAEGYETSDTRVLTAKEEAALLEAATGHWCYGAILLGLKLGLRIGEVLGLEWSDFDLKRKTVTISQQRQRISKATRDLLKIESDTGLLKVDPKSEWGFRTIPLPDSVVEWLRAERKVNTTKFLIPNIQGTNSKEPRRLTVCFNLAVKRAKIKPHDERKNPLPMPTFHDLRHTWCTRMANDYKVLPNVLMRLAGHSRIETTLGFYVHVEDGDLFEAMKNIR